MSQKLKAILIGAGKIGATYLKDEALAKSYKYLVHAQVLSDHPNFDWLATVDLEESNLNFVKENFSCPLCTKNIDEAIEFAKPDVAIIATPPHARNDILQKLKNIKGVIVEKPLAKTIKEAKDFAYFCSANDIKAQVNLWRRSDESFMYLSNGGLKEKIGKPIFARAIYTGGLRNNGVHMIDLLRMMLGEVEDYSLISAHDEDIAFLLKFNSGVSVPVQTLSGEKLREFSFEIWGDEGCLEVCDGAKYIRYRKRIPHPQVSGDFGICRENYAEIPYTAGNAFYNMYDNFAKSLLEDEPLCSNVCSALESEIIVDNIMTLFDEMGWLLV